MSVVSEHRVTTGRHSSYYLRAGKLDAPLIVLVHGWPERAISWRHQLAALADLGYLVVAPDMRGYGHSTVHPTHDDYAVEHSVQDMLELMSGLGRSSAVWIGHDWGSPVVWSLASHHPEACTAVASLCVPYHPGGFTLESLLPLVDRELYPESEFPAGQWEYFLFYREHFASAVAAFEADVENTVKLLFRSGNPDRVGSQSPTAFTRIWNGWFAGLESAPAFPIDTAVLDGTSLATYVEGLTRNGFTAPSAWYMNDVLNAADAQTSVNGGRLAMPVLFVHARYDLVCESLSSRLAVPMREMCDRLEETVVESGHWMAQEQPEALNAVLAGWLAGLALVNC